jgi:hypothetical protein
VRLYLRTFIAAATATSVLSACQQAGVQNPQSQMAGQTKANEKEVAESEKRALGQMYKHDNPVPDFDDLSGNVSVEQVVRKRKESLDLRFLAYLDKRLDKKTLEPLASPDAVNYVRSLNLANLKLNDDDIEPVARLRSLTYLNCTNDHLRTLKHVAPLTELVNLDLSGNDIDGQGTEVLSKLSKLKLLRLTNTPISDRDLPKFYGLKVLSYLGLSKCPHLTNAGIARLRKVMPHTAVESGARGSVVVDYHGSEYKPPPPSPKNPEDLSF